MPAAAPTITLQALAPEHIPLVLEVCTDWRELAQYGAPYWRPRSSAELQRKIADTAGPGPATAYTFVIADGDRLVGEVSVHTIEWHSRVGQVGICIWRPEDRGHGYGRTGTSAIIEWAQGYLGLIRLEAWILASNLASRHLFTQLGFTEEGILRSRYLSGGHHHDVHVLARVQRRRVGASTGCDDLRRDRLRQV